MDLSLGSLSCTLAFPRYQWNAWILNDLFVDEAFRKKRVAKSLMDAAENFARETESVRIVLSTQISNMAAQSLYESLGYIKDKDFCHYALQPTFRSSRSPQNNYGSGSWRR